MTGRAGVVLVTSRAGSSNLVTGLATANSEGDPVVAIGATVSVADRLKQIHQSMDNSRILFKTNHKVLRRNRLSEFSFRSGSERLSSSPSLADLDSNLSVFPMDIMAGQADGRGPDTGCT